MHGAKMAQAERALILAESITVQVVSSFTSLDSAASLLHKNNIFSPLFKSTLAKLETSCTMILPPTVSVLWLKCPQSTSLWHQLYPTDVESLRLQS